MLQLTRSYKVQRYNHKIITINTLLVDEARDREPIIDSRTCERKQSKRQNRAKEINEKKHSHVVPYIIALYVGRKNERERDKERRRRRYEKEIISLGMH